MYIEIGHRQSGKTTRIIQDILYNVISIKDIKIIVISGNMAMQYNIKNRLNDIFNRTEELREKFKKNFIFASFNEDPIIFDTFKENYIALSIVLQTAKHYKVYCDEFIYAKGAHKFLIDKIENTPGFKDNLYLASSDDIVNGKHKEIFNKFAELNGNYYVKINTKYLINFKM